MKILIPVLILFLSIAIYGMDENLSNLTTLKSFKSMRTSSVDPNFEGNGDARYIAPKDTLLIADLKGPGKITHIWFTISDNERFYGKKLVLRMFWDNEENPSVEVPLNDFFLQGHGRDVVIDSAPFRVTSEGKARNCYFVMPFRKSARIEVTNEGNEPVNAFYYYIDWQKEKSLPKDTIYFHASYRQAFPPEKGKDYQIADIEGNGTYIGTMLSVMNLSPSWFGEGDDRFYIDGEIIPSIQGTGTEDYFCDAWGFRKFHGAYYGVPIYDGMNTGDKITAYRFHIPDPITFKKSLVMEIEHKGAVALPDGSWDGYRERFDNFSSVAYWYQTEPHKKFVSLPKVNDRLYNAAPGTITIDIENTQPTISNGYFVSQDLMGLINGKQLLFSSPEEKAVIEIPFDIAESNTYYVTVHTMTSWDYGIFDIYLDDILLKKNQDLFSESMVTGIEIRGNLRDIAEGKHKLIFKNAGKNPQSEGYLVGIDAIELVPIEKIP